jgi:hypothetical protein
MDYSILKITSQQTGPRRSFSNPNSNPTPSPYSSPTPSRMSNSQFDFYQQVPNSWLKYEDKEAGILVYYPPTLVAKYNPNRGVGVSYAAGSYLIDQEGNKILDFYRISYNSGSRRKTLYEAWAFDGPYSSWKEYAKHTISSKDVTLNNRRWLRLETSLYRSYQYDVHPGNRVFWLTAVGKSLFYFTYPSEKEENPALFKQLLTVIAHSQLTDRVGKAQASAKQISCFSDPRPENKNQSWKSYLDEKGNMVVVQRTTEELEDEINLSRIELWLNNQDIKSHWSFRVPRFTIYRDSSQKEGYKDAFVIKLDKKYVDLLMEKTPSSIPSISILLKINGGLRTKDNTGCTTIGTVAYYTSR